MERISAKDIREQMEKTILPYIAAHKEDGFFERIPGKKLHYEHIRCDNEKAALVLLHGFTECAPKFYETAWYFIRMGFSVWMMEQQGHGLSYRETGDPSLVCIDHYEELPEDLHCFVQTVVRKAEGSVPLVLFGHSLGGAVSGLCIELYPKDFERAILSSPMMEIDNGGIPAWAASLLTKVLKAFGKKHTYLPGGKGFDLTPDFEHSCTNCRERYDYDLERQVSHTEYQTTAPAVTTAGEFMKLAAAVSKKENAEKVQIPVLLFQAEKDGTVLPGGQDRFMEAVGEKGRKVIMKDARHEIYRCRDEIMDLYWQEIEAFTAPVLG